MRRRSVVVAGAGTAFGAASVALASGSWYLACSDGAGNALGGADCLQYDVLPRSDAPLVGALGFLPVAALWCVSVVVLVVALRAARRRPSPG